MPSFLQTWALPIFVLAIANIAGTWFKLVSEQVPDPYLDEVFHVPQAQRYCKGDYSWDPKITTPPGLYLVSVLLYPLFGGCETPSLRMLNVGTICLICLLTYHILRNNRSRSSTKQALMKNDEDSQTYLLDAHSALNISLFPPLFFFSGLYYTDVMSTLVVLLSYNGFLKRREGNLRAWDQFFTVFIGAIALTLRQTNIFWVAVFPAGLTAIDTLKKNGTQPALEVKSTLAEVLEKSWREGLVYDCSVPEAGIMDYILILISVALASLRVPLILLKAIVPYLMLFGLFVSFVAWNGGVVLGDKSNHVATIHMPQMLYLWPYITFFSLPLFVPLVLMPFVRLLHTSQLKSFCENNLIGSSRTSAPGIISGLLFVILGLAAVHYNTIVHPFTLADNRHYVFYIFRILRRHPAIKYLAVPLYYICAWMAIQTLGSGPAQPNVERKRGKPQVTRDEEVRQPCQISFILVWLATTALSVISAPLVEPRYFIIPWVIWRINVPNVSASLSERSSRTTSYDIRLLLETVWYLIVNAVTGYVFLHRGFAWPSEPGRVQRFLW